MNSLDELVLDIKLQLKGAEDNIIKMYLSRVARDFLIKTKIWYEVLECTIENGVLDYDLITSNGDIEQIDNIYMLINEKKVKVNSFNYNITDWNLITLKEIFTEYYDTKTLYVKAIIKPFVNDLYIPSNLIERYANAFISGTINKLAMMPNYPYTNFDIGQLHLRKYNEIVTKALQDKRKGVNITNEY